MKLKAQQTMSDSRKSLPSIAAYHGEVLLFDPELAFLHGQLSFSCRRLSDSSRVKSSSIVLLLTSLNFAFCRFVLRTEKNIGLNRENAILLNKLVDISQGKRSQVHGPSVMKQMKEQKKTSSVGPRSLNISIRKKENERIIRENEAFAKRLYKNSASISRRRLDSDAKT